MEAWRGEELDKLGIPRPVLENVAFSKRGVLRGMHMQTPLQGKLVRCLEGRIYDAVADPKTRKWYGVFLEATWPSMLWVPKGYLHGYYVMSDTALVSYAVDVPWNPEGEITVRWDSLGIEWFTCGGAPIMSEKDRNAQPWMRSAA